MVCLEVPLCNTWAAFVFRAFWVAKKATIFKWQAPSDYLSVINPDCGIPERLSHQVGGVGSVRTGGRCYGELNTGMSAGTLFYMLLSSCFTVPSVPVHCTARIQGCSC